VTSPAVKLRAYLIRQKLAAFGYVRADIGFQADLYSDAAGLAVLLEPHSRYAIDGYIAYESSTSTDIKFTMSGPEGCSGHWTAFPVSQAAAAGGIGDLEALRLDDFTDAEQQGAAGSTTTPAMLCVPHGYIVTNLYGGALQVRFAQVTTTAAATKVRAGSWLRATLINQANI
jgi:hypothetical protein